MRNFAIVLLASLPRAYWLRPHFRRKRYPTHRVSPSDVLKDSDLFPTDITVYSYRRLHASPESVIEASRLSQQIESLVRDLGPIWRANDELIAARRADDEIDAAIVRDGVDPLRANARPGGPTAKKFQVSTGCSGSPLCLFAMCAGGVLTG